MSQIKDLFKSIHSVEKEIKNIKCAFCQSSLERNSDYSYICSNHLFKIHFVSSLNDRPRIEFNNLIFYQNMNDIIVVYNYNAKCYINIHSRSNFMEDLFNLSDQEIIDILNLILTFTQ